MSGVERIFDSTSLLHQRNKNKLFMVGGRQIISIIAVNSNLAKSYSFQHEEQLGLEVRIPAQGILFRHNQPPGIPLFEPHLPRETLLQRINPHGAKTADMLTAICGGAAAPRR